MSVSDLLLPRLEKASDASVPGGRRGSLYFKALQVKPGLAVGDCLIITASKPQSCLRRDLHMRCRDASLLPRHPLPHLSSSLLPSSLSPPPSLPHTPPLRPPFPRTFSRLPSCSNKSPALIFHATHCTSSITLMRTRLPSFSRLFFDARFLPVSSVSLQMKRAAVGESGLAGGGGGVSVHRALNRIFE